MDFKGLEVLILILKSNFATLDDHIIIKILGISGSKISQESMLDDLYNYQKSWL